MFPFCKFFKHLAQWWLWSEAVFLGILLTAGLFRSISIIGLPWKSQLFPVVLPEHSGLAHSRLPISRAGRILTRLLQAPVTQQLGGKLSWTYQFPPWLSLYHYYPSLNHYDSVYSTILFAYSLYPLVSPLMSFPADNSQRLCLAWKKTTPCSTNIPVLVRNFCICLHRDNKRSFPCAKHQGARLKVRFALPRRHHMRPG